MRAPDAGRGGAVDTLATVDALALEDVTCTFASHGAPARDYTAIADVGLRVGPAEFLVVVGPTGCGKSTLLNVAAGLLAPTSGRVAVFGEPLDAARGPNRRAGYLFQSEALMPWRDALGNVVVGLTYRGVAATEAIRIAREWLARVGLAGAEDRYPHQLSGGMRKRVALAQTLVLDPDIVLMDEPFSALDALTRQAMGNELLALWQARPRAVLFVTHDLDEAIALADRVVVLSAGPAARPVASFDVDLERPRDVTEIRSDPRFVELHRRIWDVLKREVSKSVASVSDR